MHDLTATIHEGVFWVFFGVTILSGFTMAGVFSYKKGSKKYKFFYHFYILFYIADKPFAILQDTLVSIKNLFTNSKFNSSNNNEYWLYNNSALKYAGRIWFLIFLIYCLYILLNINLLLDQQTNNRYHDCFCLLCSCNSLESSQTNINSYYSGLSLFFVISSAFFTSYFLSNNSLLNPPDREIKNFLHLFGKSVLLLKKWHEILIEKPGQNSLLNKDINILEYINNELHAILLHIRENKCNPSRELSFIQDALKITLFKFNKCYLNKEHLSKFKKQFKEFEKEFANLLIIYGYFLDKKETPAYKKYFSYTYIDIDEIRENFTRITQDVEKEITQVFKFIELSQ